MPEYRLTDPEIFLGCERLPSQASPYLTAWRLQQKDVSNATIRSFGAPLFTVGSDRQPQGSLLPHYDELKIFNGGIKGNYLDKLCRDLLQNRLRVNLDGYSYHVAMIQRQMGAQPQPQPVSKFLRLNDLFDWGEYAEPVPSGSTFKAEPSKTTWNRRSQTSATIIRVNYEQMDKDLNDLRDKLKTKQDDLDALQQRFNALQQRFDALQQRANDNDALQRKFDDLEQKYNDYRRRFKPGRPIPPSLFVNFSGNEALADLQFTWAAKGGVTILDEVANLPTCIPVRYDVDFDTTSWRAIVIQNARGDKSTVAIYEGNYSSSRYGLYPTSRESSRFRSQNTWGPLDFSNYDTRWAIIY